MKRDYPNLCKPIQIGNVTFRNRMCSAPLGATDILPDGTPGPRTLGWYESRARGGAAAVTVSELVVHPETDGSQMLRLSLSTPGQLGAFTYVADAIKRHGAVASIELSHSGQYAGTYMVDKKKKEELCQYGPSDGVRPDGMKVKALTKEQIDDIVAAYANAATLAKRAGFQMVMVHCGHGWLINQFLSPWFNKRDDEYGGPLENRVRFAREVLSAIREAVGPQFPIELRMSGSELFDGGYDLDEGCRIAKALEDRDLPVMFHSGENGGCHPSELAKIASEYPTVRFNFAHCRPMDEMAKVVADYPNVWTDTAYMALEDFPKLCDYDWHGRLMFGTDIPVWQAHEECSLTKRYRGYVKVFEATGLGQMAEHAFHNFLTQKK